MKTIIIIGGGIIGLSCAYFLQKEGHEIIVIDKGDLSSGCSYGNAGMITPSHFIPLASPGMIAKGIRWMFDAQSPFYIQPRFNRDLISWAWKFYRATSKKQMERAIPLLRAINLLSKKLYQDWEQELDFSFGLTQKGLLMLCREEHSLEEEHRTAELANQIGVEAKVLSVEAIRKMEPGISDEIIGGVYFPGDAHLSPSLLLEVLKKSLIKNGVLMQSQTEVIDFEQKNGRIVSVLTNKGDFHASEIIIATGSWSPLLVQKLGLSLPLQAGKGYSITLAKPTTMLNHAAILTEAKVAVTPMGNQMRFGGTMEIAGINDRVNHDRVKGILQSIPKYYQGYKVAMPSDEKIWQGLRPCTPDGLPYIGRVQPNSNLTIASGHAMLGLSLGPATGLLVAELIGGKKLSLDIDLLDPQRYL